MRKPLGNKKAKDVKGKAAQNRKEEHLREKNSANMIDEHRTKSDYFQKGSIHSVLLLEENEGKDRE